MPLKSWKITPQSHYIRRRDKALVVVDSLDGQGVRYRTKPALVEHKVSIAGFRQGFRPATTEELAGQPPQSTLAKS